MFHRTPCSTHSAAPRCQLIMSALIIVITTICSFNSQTIECRPTLRNDVCEQSVVDIRIMDHLDGRLVSTSTASFAFTSPYLRRFNWKAFVVNKNDTVRLLGLSDTIRETSLSELAQDQQKFVQLTRTKAFDNFYSLNGELINAHLIDLKRTGGRGGKIVVPPESTPLEPRTTIISAQGSVVSGVKSVITSESMMTFRNRDEWTWCESHKKKVMPFEWAHVFVFHELITVVKTDGSLLMQSEYFYGGNERDYLELLIDQMDVYSKTSKKKTH